jgi:SAM-dependent methyltransferase
MLSVVFRETLKGKSLMRTLTNIRCQEVALSGKGIDLGAKTTESSYYRFFKLEPGAEIAFADKEPMEPGMVRVDLEDRLDADADSKDFLLLMHVLEHLYDYRTCLQEAHRVLRNGGRLVGCVPFLYRVHRDPGDYFRFTDMSLERALRDAGFETVIVEPIGMGPVTAGVSLFSRLLKLKVLVFCLTSTAIVLDRLLVHLFRQNQNVQYANFPLAYYFIATK